MYKKAVPVTTTRPSDKVKQLVLPFKVIGFAYQSRSLSKVKQLVLLHQLIYFLTANPYTQSRSWPTDVSKVIKHYMKMFADLASATLKQVADWFDLFLHYCELNFLYSALINIGEDEGVVQRFALCHRLSYVFHLVLCKYVLEEEARMTAWHKAYLIGKR